MSEEKEISTVETSSGTDPVPKKGKSKEQEKFDNLHPLRARLYDNVHLSLRTMDIIVAVVAIALLVVFFIGVATGTRTNLN